MNVHATPDLVLSTSGVTAVPPRGRAGIVGDYFAAAGARTRLLVVSAVLSYGGGAAMFWLHAIYRGERGPAIANQWHWMLDSSLGFLSLTPVLVLVLPMARELAAGRGRRLEAVLTGALFALVTTPGPILHDLVAGEGTPLAHLATRVFGSDPHVLAAHVTAVEHSGTSEALLQLAVGLPVYVLLTYLATTALARRSARSARSGRAAHRPATISADLAEGLARAA